MNNSMECSCIYDPDIDNDNCDFLNQRYPVVARKSYKCCECDAEISKGEEYEYTAGKWDGNFTVYRTCRLCVTIRTDFCCHSYYFGGLQEALWEALGINYVTGEIQEGA